MRVAPLCLIAASAYANPNDSLQLSAAVTYQHDDNLFRLTPGANALATIGRSSAAETVRNATGAVSFIKDYGLQHVEVTASAVNYDYQNFSYLNFTAINYNGLLRWSLTPRIRGTITADRRETLASFGDFQNFNVRNEYITTNTRAEGIYELDGAWQLTGAGMQQSVKNSATITQTRAFSQHSADVGVKRVFSSGTEAAYRIRKGSGSYSDLASATASGLPSSFDITENELSLIWLITAKSKLNALVTYRQKRFNDFDYRDYNGVQMNTALTLGLTSRTSLLLGVARDLGDYQTPYSNSSTTDRLIVEPAWQIKEKVALKFHQEFMRRRFNGSVPGTVVLTQREDNLFLSKLSVEWQPREQFDLSAWLQRDKRDSNYTGFPYLSRSVGVTAQVTF